MDPNAGIEWDPSLAHNFVTSTPKRMKLTSFSTSPLERQCSKIDSSAWSPDVSTGESSESAWSPEKASRSHSDSSAWSPMCNTFSSSAWSPDLQCSNSAMLMYEDHEQNTIVNEPDSQTRDLEAVSLQEHMTTLSAAGGSAGGRILDHSSTSRTQYTCRTKRKLIEMSEPREAALVKQSSSLQLSATGEL